MNFFMGYVIGRSMAGPRRKAAPGSALPLYGGVLAMFAGICIVYWNETTNPAGWLIAGIGLLGFITGACMQGSRDDRSV